MNGFAVLNGGSQRALQWFAVWVLMAGTGCLGFFKPIPPKVPFDSADTPTGDGWYCAVLGEKSFCERDLRTCASKQANTPGTSACVQWADPAHCFTVRADGSALKELHCSMDFATCDAEGNSWRGPGTSGVGDVSECQAIP